MVLVIDMQSRAVLYASGDDKAPSGDDRLTLEPEPNLPELGLMVRKPEPAYVESMWLPGLLPAAQDDDPNDAA